MKSDYAKGYEAFRQGWGFDPTQSDEWKEGYHDAWESELNDGEDFY